MEKVRPWCGQPSDQGQLKNRTVTTALKCTVLSYGQPTGQTYRETDGRTDGRITALLNAHYRREHINATRTSTVSHEVEQLNYNTNKS